MIELRIKRAVQDLKAAGLMVFAGELLQAIGTEGHEILVQDRQDLADALARYVSAAAQPDTSMLTDSIHSQIAKVDQHFRVLRMAIAVRIFEMDGSPEAQALSEAASDLSAINCLPLVQRAGQYDVLMARLGRLPEAYIQTLGLSRYISAMHEGLSGYREARNIRAGYMAQTCGMRPLLRQALEQAIFRLAQHLSCLTSLSQNPAYKSLAITCLQLLRGHSAGHRRAA